MKKSVFLCLFALVLCVFLAGCGEQKSESKNGPFTMTCTTQQESFGNLETQTAVVYSFNEDQYVTEYSATTSQKFGDKELYEQYLTAQQETVKNALGDDILYELEAFDDDMIINFTMKYQNIYNNAKTDDDKSQLKANKILETNEDRGATCELNGINKDQLK